MALPMVHLATAYEWSKKYNKAVFNSPEFYLGAISPDAIHSRPNADKDDKRKTHFYTNNKTGDVQNTVDFIKNHKDPFSVGYAIHVLTDSIWVRYYVDNFPGLFDENGKTIPSLYYNDTDQVDYMLYEKLPYRQFMFDMMEKSTSPNLDDLLTSEEIEAWKQRTLHWFENDCPHTDPIKHLTYEKICYFINIAPAMLEEALKSNENIIYQ